MAIEGPSREGFLFYPVYHFSNGAAGYPREAGMPHILPDGQAHEWTLEYAPPEGSRPGRLLATLGEQAVTVPVTQIPPEADFDRFGIVTTWIDGNSQRVYFDDLTYTCRQ